MALYTWWKHIRPARKDSWEETGFREFMDKMEAKYGKNWYNFGGQKKMSAAEERTYTKLSNLSDDLDEERIKEDEEMLIRLIKVRRSIWT